MGAMKRIAIALERGAQLTTHHWKFVENRSNSLQARVAYAQLLNEYVVEFARTLDTADHAVDAIESPHDTRERSPRGCRCIEMSTTKKLLLSVDGSARIATRLQRVWTSTSTKQKPASLSEAKECGSARRFHTPQVWRTAQ